MKKLICLKKSHIKSKKLHQRNNFLFKFYTWIRKNCRNRLVLDRDIANLFFRDNVQIWKTRFVLKNLGKKKYLQNHVTF